MTRVKICGLSDIESAMAAAEAGADFLGFVFAPSRRQITPEKARELVAAVKSTKKQPEMVGVFVNIAAQEVNSIAVYCGLDRVQLSGSESWQYSRDIWWPVIKAIHVTEKEAAGDIIREIEKGYAQLGKDRLTCLLDTHSAAAYGGTGQIFDWKMARDVASRFQVMVAGGLTPDNIVQLVSEVQPWGVDVSSGVESNGRKDVQKIRDFIQKVRSAEKTR